MPRLTEGLDHDGPERGVERGQAPAAPHAAEDCGALDGSGPAILRARSAEVTRAARCPLTRRERSLVLGLALEDACADDRARLLAGLPAPARLAWRLAGRRRYRATVVRLRGAPPAR